MTNESSYFVILRRIEDFEPQKLADALSRILNVPRLDVLMDLRRYWGILHETQEVQKAQELQRLLEQENIETFILAASKLKRISLSKVLKEVIPTSEGLSFKEGERNKVLPWRSFILLCAGKIEETVDKKVMQPPDGKVGKWVSLTGITPLTAIAISREMAKMREKVIKETEFNYYLDLVTQENGEDVRIVGDSFDYSYLKERKDYNLFNNFKNLVFDIVGFLPHSVKNRGIYALKQQSNIKGFKYNNVGEYEYEKLWLLQLACMKE